MKWKCGYWAAGALLASGLNLLAADITAPGSTVSVLITVESKAGETPITADEIRIQQNRSNTAVAGLRPVSGSRSQMLLLIDDSAGGSFDTQISELKSFLTSLPTNVEVGVGYMHNGMADMTSPFTADHAKAANSIRLALGVGGADVSPYDSLSDAVKKWPKEDGVERREVIMISSGLEGLGGGLPPDNPYVNAGIADAQKAGVVVYAIYNPAFGHAGHSLWRATTGQNFLSQLTDETGGELYVVGFGAPVSVQPYLEDILKRQTEQYVLTFDARAEKKSGLEQVKVTSMRKGVSIAAPDKVYVKAGL